MPTVFTDDTFGYVLPYNNGNRFGKVARFILSNFAMSPTLTDTKDPKLALDVFGYLQHQRVQPNMITYNSVISAYEKGKDPERALGVSSLISACEKAKDPKLACELADQCMRERERQGSKASVGCVWLYAASARAA